MLNDVKWFGFTTSFPYLCIVLKFKYYKLYAKINKGKTIS